DLGRDGARVGAGVGDVPVHPLPDEVAGLALDGQVGEVRPGGAGRAQAQGAEDEQGETPGTAEHAELSFLPGVMGMGWYERSVSVRAWRVGEGGRTPRSA